jgi:hypothetical protein
VLLQTQADSLPQIQQFRLLQASSTRCSKSAGQIRQGNFQEAQTVSEEHSSDALPVGTAAQPYFSMADGLFSAFMVVVLVAVSYLGFVTYIEGSETEHTKRNAEQIVKWLEEAAKARAEGQAVSVEACAKDGQAWSDCLNALVAESGPFPKLRNVAEVDGVTFSKKCDREQLNTHGAIILEKGTPKPVDPSSFTFGPMDDAEVIAKDSQLRVLVCGRGFSVIKIGEVKY